VLKSGDPSVGDGNSGAIRALTVECIERLQHFAPAR
jgi:hypothetical protein